MTFDSLILGRQSSLSCPSVIAQLVISIFILCQIDCVIGERPQIGHYPFIGDMWRSKPPWTMKAQPSPEFQVFAARLGVAQSRVSEESYRTYYFSMDRRVYEHLEADDTVCSYTLDHAGVLLMNSSETKNFQMRHFFQPLLVYFVCDDMCCSEECCERDWPLTIAGYGLFGAATAVILTYAFIYLIGFYIAGKNGKLCRNTETDFDMRGSCAPLTAFSSVPKFSSNNCDDDMTKV
uniref:CX domain-containing protein n=1 Tax=Plectus sambesii TaxID=2011161 RepID=A0A914X8V4_9BILA